MVTEHVVSMIAMFRQATTPANVDLPTRAVVVGDFWYDTVAAVYKRCSSISPITFVSVEGGSAAHNVLSTTHGDSFATDVPANNEVLTWIAVNSRWESVAAATQSFGVPTGQIDLGDANSEGVGANGTRTDHQHSFPAPAAGYPIDADFSAEADGVGTAPARSDHRHTLTAPAAPADVTKAAAAAGTATAPARQDHKHDITTAAPGAVMAAAAAEGAATSLARSNHVHSYSGSKLRSGIAIENPVANDNFGGFYTTEAVTITKVGHSKLAGTNVVYNIRHAAARNSGVPNNVWTVDQTVTTEAGAEIIVFDDATIPADSYLWFFIVSISGVPTRFESHFEYTVD